MKTIKCLGLICSMLPFLTGCRSQHRDVAGSIVYAELQDSVIPVRQNGMPRCRFKASVACFDSDSDKAAMLNAQIANCFSLANDSVTYTSPEKAVQHFCDNFIQLYNDETAPLVHHDFADGMPAAEMPEWYNVTRDVRTQLFCGRDSIICYVLSITDDKGGIHPDTYMFWYNFDMRDASRITVATYLNTDADGLIQLLEEELVKTIAGKTDDEIAGMEELRKEYGIPYGDDLYIPENFLITESCVCFLYNRHEIAPYAFGDIQLEIPYDKIKHFLKKRINSYD